VGALVLLGAATVVSVRRRPAGADGSDGAGDPSGSGGAGDASGAAWPDPTSRPRF
jgi:hypothetical protein